MPRITYRGIDIHFDTLEEAVAAAERLASGAHASSADNNGARLTPGSTGDSRWTMSRFKDYINRLSQQQLRMLQELVRVPHGKTARDLASTLGFESAKAFGPVVAAMSKHARNAGIALEEVMTSDRVTVGRDKLLEFRATPAFLKIATEAGWKTGE